MLYLTICLFLLLSKYSLKVVSCPKIVKTYQSSTVYVYFYCVFLVLRILPDWNCGSLLCANLRFGDRETSCGALILLRSCCSCRAACFLFESYFALALISEKIQGRHHARHFSFR